MAIGNIKIHMAHFYGKKVELVIRNSTSVYKNHQGIRNVIWSHIIFKPEDQNHTMALMLIRDQIKQSFLLQF